METIISNAGAARRETLHGRDFIVAPAVLLRSDLVLDGSQGPGFYPAEEVENRAHVDEWNGMPIVVRHPRTKVRHEQTGRDEWVHVSARSPEIIQEWGIGNVWHAEAKDGKLLAELWFDVERVKNSDLKLKSQGVAPLLPKLLNAQPIDLSTGLDPVKEKTAGRAANGDHHAWIARQPYRPDHVAVLPDEKGACSVEDGCGVNVNARMCWGRPCGEGSSGKEGSSESFIEAVSSSSGFGEGSMRVVKTTNDKRTIWQRLGQLLGVTSNESALPSSNIDPGKACEILEDGEANGRALTDEQRGMFGAACGKTANAWADVDFEAILNARNAKRNRSTSNKRRSKMTLTANQRAFIVRDLTTNCDCHKGKDKALNALDDEQLESIHNAHQITLVVNSLKSGRKLGTTTNAEGEGEAVPGVPWTKLAQLLQIDIDPRSDPVGFAAALKSALDDISSKLGGTPSAPPPPPSEEMSAGAANMEDEDEEEMATNANGNSKKVTEAQWLANAPASVRNCLMERYELIGRLIANVAPAKRKERGERLFRMTLDELRDRAADLPPVVNESARGFDFSLASGPTVNADDAAADAEDIAFMDGKM
jgi:hypothetical protein